jgi:hypothetical protein
MSDEKKVSDEQLDDVSGGMGAGRGPGNPGRVEPPIDPPHLADPLRVNPVPRTLE